MTIQEQLAQNRAVYAALLGWGQIAAASTGLSQTSLPPFGARAFDYAAESITPAAKEIPIYSLNLPPAGLPMEEDEAEILRPLREIPAVRYPDAGNEGLEPPDPDPVEAVFQRLDLDARRKSQDMGDGLF